MESRLAHDAPLPQYGTIPHPPSPTKLSFFFLLAWQAIADALKDSAASIQCALLDDMYTRRKPMEIHPSLAAFAQALQLSQNLRVLDMRLVWTCRLRALVWTCLDLSPLSLAANISRHLFYGASSAAQ